MFVLMLDRGFSLDSFGVDGSRLRVSLGTVGSSNFHFARWSLFTGTNPQTYTQARVREEARQGGVEELM
jgi:hypothetical protein